VTHIDLFSGIGGFALAAGWAGFTTRLFCEIDPFCRRVLAKHWPSVPIVEDVRDVTAESVRRMGVGRVDLLTGGFPCQPFSSASHGRRRGRDGDRYLWPEMRRVVSELRPAWVCGENVAHLDGLALDEVCSDLEALGYAVQTFEIPACAVDADHVRRRLWVLAHADGDREPGRPVHAETPELPRPRDDARGVGAANGLPGGVDSPRRRMSAIGNAIVPQVAYPILAAIAAEVDAV
jgi:DNA (cytosine-5)-methyltransferase 1